MDIICPNPKGVVFEGKVAIVTGSSSGIGEAIARALARAGVKVAIAARRAERLEEIKKSIIESGGTAIVVKTDVTSSEEVSALVRETERKLGPVDVLVNGAGVMYYTLMRRNQVDQWHRTIDINCKGVVNCIGAVLEGMIQRNSGHIVNISSDAGRRGFGGIAVYSGSKFFVEGMSRGLREEVKGHGVRVTCMQPGNTRTELLDHTTDQEARDEWDESKLHLVMEPEDIARAVLYALSQPDYLCVNELLVEPKDECI